MSFESPDMAKDFPGLYLPPGTGNDNSFDEEDKPARRKEVVVRRREARPERRGKGYRMFEEENSEEELVAEDMTKSPSKMKKHSKPSFKFTKKDKLKPKEKEREVHVPATQPSRERDKSADKHDKGEGHKDKKKEDKVKWRKRKLLGPGATDADSKSDRASSGGSARDLRPVFGVPLAQAVERNRCHDGIQLPIIFRECIDYIEEFGLNSEGIYRMSGVKSKVAALKDQYNQHMHVYLHEHEPNTVASLLKLFLRELPEPVLTKELMPKFEEASTLKNVKQKVEAFQVVIEQLPIPNKLLLSWMIVHMTHVIAREKQNKMSLQNVSIVLSPTMHISHRVLNVLFTYARILFKDTIIKRYVPPLKPVTSKWSLDLPESPSALEEELLKQESLLSQLHEDVMKHKDSNKEEQLWEVQRVVTQLKRKIKMMKKTQKTELAREQEIIQSKQDRETKPKFSPSSTMPPISETKSLKTVDVVVEEEPEVDNSVEIAEEERSEIIENAENDSEPVESNEENNEILPEPVVMDKSTEDLAVDNPDVVVSDVQAIHSDDDLTPTEHSEGFDKIPDTEDDLARSSNVDIHQVETLADTPDTPQVENLEFIPKVEDNMEVANTAENVPLEDENTQRVSTSSAEEQEQDNSEDSSENEEEYQSWSPIAENDDQAPPPYSDSDSDTDTELLQQQYNELLVEEEELIAMGDELKQKIDTEQSEIGRLHQEIEELKGMYDSEDASSDSSDDLSDDDNLHEALEELTLQNRQLEIENQDLAHKIQLEREICLNVKVQIRMIQQRQLESSGGMLLMDGINESTLLIDSLL